MPNPPAQPPTNLVTQIGFTAGGGPQLMPEPTQVHSLPALAPPVSSNASSSVDVMGVDAVQFSFALSGGVGSQTVTFPQLPDRNNTMNPISPPTTAAQQPFIPQPIDLLIFLVNTQNLVAPNGTVVGVSGLAITKANLRVVGPFLGHDQYLTFQATITANSSTATGTVSGFVTAMLFLASG